MTSIAALIMHDGVEGTNIDPRSILSTDYFNHFNTVIILFSVLPDCTDILDEIDQWQFMSYSEYFRAIECYEQLPQATRGSFEQKVGEMKTVIEKSRFRLRCLLDIKHIRTFTEMSKRVINKLRYLSEVGGAIVHSSDAHDQGASLRSFKAWSSI